MKSSLTIKQESRKKEEERRGDYRTMFKQFHMINKPYDDNK